MIDAAKKWVGYLEHKSNDRLGFYQGNVGKGGCTIFAMMIWRHYRQLNFSGLPWCAVFVHAVFIEALGKDKARSLLGKPQAGTRQLLRRFKRRGLLRAVPKPGDVVFLTNGSGRVEHCGIVVAVDGDEVITVEGNTVDPSGIFQKHEGGAVAQRVRKWYDPAIVCYGGIEL